jgi:SpoVK/Ycf46/Vps4 family AAA+-type ATPase
MFDKARPPIMVGVEVAPGKTIQVAWGRIAIPNVVGFIETAFTEKNGRIIFEVRGEVLKKHASEIAELATLARKYAKEESLYRGAAIRASFANKRDVNGHLIFNILDVPKFMDVEDDKAKELVFSDSVNEQIRTSLFVPIEKTELCRKHKIPLKRGVLLEGRYGVGKTLTAYVAARKCVENGWTFIYIERVAELEAALKFAAQYQPAMIFAEDVDRVVEGERSVAMDDILNTLDGIESKASETIVVLTTNHVEKINKAMLRPGRLDAVISILPPDAAAAEKLLRLYGRGLLDATTNVMNIATMLAGQIPAVIREVVERSKLAAIARLDVGELRIDSEDLATAAKGMLSHLALLEQDKEADMNEDELLGFAFRAVVENAIEEAAEERVEENEEVDA